MEQLSSGDPEVIGPYRLVSRLGSGAMGQVFLAEASGRRVALKVIQPGLAHEHQFKARFRQEVRAAQRVTGQYTAAVLAADPDGEPAWMATEYVPGPTLQALVEEQGPLPVKEIVRLASDIATALMEIHDAGVVHRDLKPTNVVVPPAGPVRVIDFGIARAADATLMTATGLSVGSVGYMSPEQANGERRVGPEADVFALGALLYFAATGEPVFGSGSTPAVLYRVVHNQPDVSAIANSGLRSVIDACLAKQRSDRPSAEDIKAACSSGTIQWNASNIEKQQHHHPAPTEETPTLAPTQLRAVPAEAHHSQSRRRTPLLVAGFLVMLLAVGGVAWLFGGPTAVSSTSPPLAITTPPPAASTPASGSSSTYPTSTPPKTGSPTTSSRPRPTVTTTTTTTTTITPTPPSDPPSTTYRPTAPPGSDDSGPLVVDGTMDKVTVRALQRVLNERYGERLIVDGVVGKQTRSALQRALGVPVTGKRNEATTRALQRHVGAGVDGIWGNETTTQLQRALNGGWF